MKKSFIIHIDSLSILDKLSNEQKGILFEAIRQHHLGNEIDLDFAMSLAFEPFKNQFDRDLITYENRCKINKANGSKGGKQKVANGSKRKQTQANLADSDNDSDSVNDKDKEELKEEFLSFWNTYDKKIDSKKAWEKFQKLKTEEITIILSTVANYVNSNPEKKFRKNPVTYLNNKCWNDEITIKDKVHSSGVVLGLDVLGSAMGKQDYNQKIMKSLCDKYGYSIEEIGEMHKDALRKKGHTEEGIKELYKMYNY